MAATTSKQLSIHLRGASDLVDKDRWGKSDPYAVVFVNDREVCRTKIIDGDLNPVWDEKFNIRTSDEIYKLKVEVFDKDVGGKSTLGWRVITGSDIGEVFEGGPLSGPEHGEVDFTIEIVEQDSKMLNATIRHAKDLHDGDFMGVSDPYAVIYLNGEEVAKTQVVENDLNPRWNESFDIPYVGEIESLKVEVYDWDKENDDTLTSLGYIDFLPYECKGTVHGGPLKGNQEKGSILSTLDFDIVIDSMRKDFGVPQPTSFVTRENCTVHLYHDAHSDPTLPAIVNEDEEKYGYVAGDCWVDVYNALDQAQKFIYLTGWSIDTKISLLRDTRSGKEKDETIGELLARKASEGVCVCVHVWDEATSGKLAGQDGMMGTHDEETVRVLNESGCHAIKSYRDGHSSFLFTHHQKTIIYDADTYDGADGRRIGAFVGGLDLCDGRWDTPKHTLYTTLAYEHKLDFHNPWLTVSQQVGPREPWHDIHSKLDGAVARDVLRNFEERWVKQSEEDKKDALFTITDEEFISEDAETGNSSGDDTWTVQLFRSIDSYSVPQEGVQRSIQDAYINAIRAAEHFIYIENQYFLGSCMYWDQNRKAGCINQVPYELAAKVCEKIREKRRFAVYILIPMYPEGVPASGAVQEVLLWQLRTQTFMNKMVFDCIKEVYGAEENRPAVTDFLNFYCVGARESGEGSEAEFLNVEDFEAKTELDELLAKSKRFAIYVHSKMMIVDDHYAIVGSANINERSMSGDRDSEIAMGGYQPAAMTSFGGRGEVHKFRLSCWAEHTLEADPIFMTPSSIYCVRKFNEIAEKNWATFNADEIVDMPSHLLKYPISVGPDGETISDAIIPDTDAPIQGDGSLVLVNILTT